MGRFELMIPADGVHS